MIGAVIAYAWLGPLIVMGRGGLTARQRRVLEDDLTRHHRAMAVGLGLVHALSLGLVLALVGVLGDLVESMFKRATNIKDSGGLLPGMGGILDMFDSLTFSPAVLYFYLAWFVGQTVCA